MPQSGSQLTGRFYNINVDRECIMEDTFQRRVLCMAAATIQLARVNVVYPPSTLAVSPSADD